MLLRKIMDVYCGSDAEHSNTLCGQNTEVGMFNLAASIAINKA
jgi:hypothetical protein